MTHSKAIADVIAERQRQIEKEGWTAEHDDNHTENDLARAALAYVGHYVRRSWRFYVNPADYSGAEAPDDWPWDGPDWKPTTPRRDLVKAAALIIAEIDRIDRAIPEG